MAIIQTVDANTLDDWIKKGEVVLIDVREAHEFSRGYVPQAILMPLSTIGSAKLPDAGDKKLAVICATGARSAMAAERLFAHHYDAVYNVDGGMMGWQMAGLDIARDEGAPVAPPAGFFSQFRRNS